MSAGAVALITGGSRGLGRAAARALTGEGWQVAITGRDAASLDAVVDEGEATLALPGDASDPEDVQAAVSRTQDELGPIDLLLANAGAFSTGGRLWDSDPDQWWHDVTVNLRGPALALHAALPAMVDRGAGRIVLMGSGFGMRPTPGASAYAVSKAAVARLVDTVAGELDGTGVTLVAVSPGMVATDMTRGFPEGFLGFRPELRDPAPERWSAPEGFTGLLLRVASGEFDALHGHFVRPSDDLETALAAAAAAPEPGTLRLVPWQ